jgi:hypothetical protein
MSYIIYSSYNILPKINTNSTKFLIVAIVATALVGSLAALPTLTGSAVATAVANDGNTCDHCTAGGGGGGSGGDASDDGNVIQPD